GDTCKTTVSVPAIDAAPAARTVEIYPNPFDDRLTIRCHPLPPEDCRLALFDPIGRLLDDIQVSAGDGEIINTAALPAGIYFWQVYAGGRVIDGGKIVKGHF
ncbi:MAG: T9SS type A sorting domain-containing protein, partial [Saprospiraceae bacterium]|nr:T9SS type A sorting domain-containing protein [Saprospiraceae bacterium]